MGQERDPSSYTPPHLAEKILTTRSALEGERKQVTVMFADINDATELIRDLDPEAAQRLLEPAIHIMMDHEAEVQLTQAGQMIEAIAVDQRTPRWHDSLFSAAPVVDLYDTLGRRPPQGIGP